MNLPNNCQAKIEVWHLVIPKPSESCITVSVDLSLSFSRKIKKSAQNREMYIILWVTCHIKTDYMSLMDYSLVLFFWVSINNQRSGFRLPKPKFKTEFWNIAKKRSDLIYWSFVKTSKEKYIFVKYQTEKEILNLKV